MEQECHSSLRNDMKLGWSRFPSGCSAVLIYWIHEADDKGDDVGEDGPVCSHASLSASAVDKNPTARS